MRADKFYVVRRAVTRAECPWLDADVRKGTIVRRYDGCAYGCVSPDGMAVTFDDGELPFFELPQDALEVLRCLA